MVGDEVFQQLLGVPIGLDITRVLGRIIMLIFYTRFRNTLITDDPDTDLMLDLRYVDDKNVILDIIRVYETMNDSERRTANNLKYIADNIFHDIFSLTVDVPINHSDRKLPIVDLKVWVDDQDIIKYEFKAKPTALKGVINRMQLAGNTRFNETICNGK